MLMIKRLFLNAVALIGLLFSASSQSQEEDWYLGLGFSVFDVKINDESFFPRQLNVRGGYWLKPGIGLELMAGGSVGSDETEGFDLDTKNMFSASIRWQSLLSRAARAYILTGYSQLVLDGAVDNTGYPGDESFNGPLLGLGVLFSLGTHSAWSAGLGYTHYFLEEELTTESIDAAIHYDF